MLVANRFSDTSSYAWSREENILRKWYLECTITGPSDKPPPASIQGHTGDLFFSMGIGEKEILPSCLYVPYCYTGVISTSDHLIKENNHVWSKIIASILCINLTRLHNNNAKYANTGPKSMIFCSECDKSLALGALILGETYEVFWYI